MNFSLTRLLFATLVLILVSVSVTLFVVDYSRDSKKNYPPSSVQNGKVKLEDQELKKSYTGLKTFKSQSVGQIKKNEQGKSDLVNVVPHTEFISADIPKNGIVYDKKMTPEELRISELSLIDENDPVYSKKMSAHELRASELSLNEAEAE